MPLINLTLDQINAGLRSPGTSLGASQFTYSIPGAGSVWPGYAAGDYPSTSYSTLNTAQAANFRLAVRAWDELIAPNFTEVADNGSGRGEVRIALTRLSGTNLGVASSSAPTAPGGRTGDIWLDTSRQSATFDPTTTSFDTMLHELGHVLGLKHPFETPTLPSLYASKIYSVMWDTTPSTLNQVHFQWTLNPDGSASLLSTPMRPSTPMVLDVAAVQAIYGADPTTRAGDTVYTFVQGSLTVQTIYDAGGTDTLDFSNFTRPNTIDLRGGAYSNVGEYSAQQQYLDVAAPYANSPSQAARANAQRFISYAQSQIASYAQNGAVAYEYRNNLAIAFGTVIEKVIGGSAGDSIGGNEVANVLYGNGGADSLSGLDGDDYLDGGEGIDLLEGNNGNDTLVGGQGNDFLAGGSGDDVYLVQDAGDAIYEDRNRGRADTLYATVSYALSADAEIENFAAATAVSTVGLALTGNQFGQAIAGTFGNDTITGAGSSVNGGDILIGLRGDDLYVVDAPNILLIEAAGEGNDSATILASASGFILNGDGEVETLTAQAGTAAINITGNLLSQRIVGNSGNNLLSTGGGGADTLDGGLGDDTYRVHGTVAIVDAGGNDVLYTSGTFRLFSSAGIETISTAVQAGTETIDITGNDFGQLIVGNFGTNMLDGRGGNDTLIGLQGADIFAFTGALGAGNVDTIQDFASGIDRIGLASDVFAGVVSGGIVASEFVVGTSATTTDQRLIYNQATGQLFYDADANGAGAAVLFAQLGAGTALTAADFIAVAPAAG